MIPDGHVLDGYKNGIAPEQSGKVKSPRMVPVTDTMAVGLITAIATLLSGWLSWRAAQTQIRQTNASNQVERQRAALAAFSGEIYQLRLQSGQRTEAIHQELPKVTNQTGKVPFHLQDSLGADFLKVLAGYKTCLTVLELQLTDRDILSLCRKATLEIPKRIASYSQEIDDFNESTNTISLTEVYDLFSVGKTDKLIEELIFTGLKKTQNWDIGIIINGMYTPASKIIKN